MWISVVHHFVEKFIDNNEVISDGLFLYVLEITFENADEGVNEGEHHDCVVVFFGDGDYVEIVMFMEVEEMVFFVLDDGFERVFIVLEYLFVEGVIDVAGEVRTEVA